MSASRPPANPLAALARLCLFGVICALSACALPQAREGQARVFALSIETAANPSSASQRQLLVETPVASGLLDSDRVVVRAGPDEFGLLRGARWSEPLPQLWQRTLIRSIEDDGRLRAGRARDALAGDERLLGELRAFEYAVERSEVRVHFHAKRVDARQRIVAERSFEASAEVRGSDAANVVEAFNAASAAMLSELIKWLVEERP
jgi:cholesterol transport system auxiliary component